MLAELLATKSACDETIPGYAAKQRNQHQGWVSRNCDLVLIVGSGQYNGMSFDQRTAYVKAEFRRQAPVDQQQRCQEIVALYSAHLANRVFMIE